MSDFWQIIEQLLRLDFSSLYDFSPLAIFFIILFATFLTEDGACFAAGALAAQGKISFAVALSACFAGIFIGDIGLYWIGRLFGSSISQTRIFKRMVSDNSLQRASNWLNEKGPVAIVISRFVSGLRLPTYLVAGFLKTNFAVFSFYFFVATAIWTPILVGSSAFAFQLIPPQYILLGILSLFIIFRIIFTLTSWPKRRLFIGRLKRIRNWEFWPLKIFYFPVFLYVLFLALKHRSLTVFTCANPAIPASGFIGESKDEIYRGLSTSEFAENYLLKHIVITERSSETEKTEKIQNFIKDNNLSYPFALKPDVGERGQAVEIVREESELDKKLSEAEGDFILQEFAAGEEVSIFYYRYPNKEKGKIFSITEKRFPVLEGDGESTLEELILMDERAVSLAQKYFEQNQERLEEVPEEGEKVQIINIGTHSRGAIFMEGDWLKTPQLEKTTDKICRGFKGFYFGRFDIRALSFEDLKRGENFKIIELNGVTSESTNIYDQRYSLFDAYKILFRQWKIAFEIGAENYQNGATKTSASDLIRLLFGKDITTQ
jgi:membrane protein DedA with SNARE-associated domain